ncbi:MAG: aminotransferase class I/II-fold pyridoxal phosphate-dependent enzyme [Microbacteriaceae bacterium]|nr:aminotransferase class I/II-fold pyridoxal phosphate-dependent enzyme [Microbacteriaceae bacterium]
MSRRSGTTALVPRSGRAAEAAAREDRAVDVEAEPLERLRQRTSEKWRAYPPDVLPLFVAEMDYPLAPPIVDAVVERVRASDSGYVSGAADAGVAFAGFAERRWGWHLDPSRVRITTDVSVAIVEVLRRVISPGDGVVITSPVYAPFADLVAEAGGRVVDVPLGPDHALDIGAIDAALGDGARAVLISNPHNPLGLPHPADALARLAAIAAAHGAHVVADEIHGPLTWDASAFTPFASVSDAAREWGVTVTSASKAWNLAGFKCALMVAASDRGLAVLDGMFEEVTFRTSILGYHATVAAFTHGDEWLDGAIAAIRSSSQLLENLLASELPEVGYTPPSASYLAWLDMRGLAWGDDPAGHALEAGRVALNSGLTFGPSGAGFARLNFACSPEVLGEAVRRLAAAR